MGFASDTALTLGYSDVYVKAGTYAGVIDARDGITVSGGYDAAWVDPNEELMPK